MSVTNSIRATLERQITEDVNWFLAYGVWKDGGFWADDRNWTTSAQPNQLTGSPAISVDNDDFKPVQNQAYIRAHFMPALRRAATAGPRPENRHSGTLMLMIHAPAYQGSGAALNLADELLERFDNHTSLLGVDANVSIQYSEVKDGASVPPFYVVPVEVGWYAFK